MTPDAVRHTSARRRSSCDDADDQPTAIADLNAARPLGHSTSDTALMLATVSSATIDQTLAR